MTMPALGLTSEAAERLAAACREADRLADGEAVDAYGLLREALAEALPLLYGGGAPLCEWDRLRDWHAEQAPEGCCCWWDGDGSREAPEEGCPVHPEPQEIDPEEARRAEAVTLLGRLLARERDPGARGYTEGVMERIRAGENASEAYVARLRAALEEEASS